MPEELYEKATAAPNEKRRLEDESFILLQIGLTNIEGFSDEELGAYVRRIIGNTK